MLAAIGVVCALCIVRDESFERGSVELSQLCEGRVVLFAESCYRCVCVCDGGRGVPYAFDTRACS